VLLRRGLRARERFPLTAKSREKSVRDGAGRLDLTEKSVAGGVLRFTVR
jgi:hypothetical protein